MANKKVQITLSDEVLVKLENLAKEKKGFLSQL